MQELEKKRDLKQKKVKAEEKRLFSILRDIDQNKLAFVKQRVSNLAWLNISIIELSEKVDLFGTMIKYDNGGGQSGYRENPDVKTLISYQKNANAITRQIIDLVPSTRKESMLKALMDEDE